MDENMIAGLAKKNVAEAPSLSDIFCNALKGKTAIVTGGASGLGYNVVHRLAEGGANVVIASRSEGKGMAAVKDFTEMGYSVKWVRTDVSRVEDCYNAVDFAVREFGGLDVMVANASGWASRSFLDVDEALYDSIVDVAMKGAYFVAQAAARHMVANKIKGHIVLVSSAAHQGDCPTGLVMNTYYQGAKAAVVQMTKGISAELKQYGIHVNCVAPGGMLSAGIFTQGQDAPALYGEEYLETRKAHGGYVPTTRNPDEVARVIYAMCTPMADFMHGALVDVNGGSQIIDQQKPFSFTVPGCIPGPKE